MAVSITSNQQSYVGNGSTTVFPIPFKFFANGDISVVHTPSGITLPLTQGVDYTVSGAGSDSGGSITTTVAPINGDVVVITRTTALTQSTVLSAQGPFPPKAITDAIDRVTLELQEEAATRAAQVATLTSQLASPPPAQTVVVNSARQNLVLNGGFELAQRYAGPSGVNLTPLVSAPVFGFDRWLCGGQTTSILINQYVTGLPTGYSSRALISVSGSAAGNPCGVICQEIDRDFLAQNQGRAFTLSAWLAASLAGATSVKAYVFTAVSGTTGRIQNFPNSGTAPNGYASGGSNLLTTTVLAGPGTLAQAQVNLGQITIPANVTAMCVMFVIQVSNIADFLEITGVQLNPGSSPMVPHEYVGGSQHAELLECRRYYEKSYELGTAPGTSTRAACEFGAIATLEGNFPVTRFRVTKRVTPNVTIYNPYSTTSGKMYCDGEQTANATPTAESIYVVAATGSPSVGDGTAWHWTADAEI